MYILTALGFVGFAWEPYVILLFFTPKTGKYRFLHQKRKGVQGLFISRIIE